MVYYKKKNHDHYKQLDLTYTWLPCDLYSLHQSLVNYIIQWFATVRTTFPSPDIHSLITLVTEYQVLMLYASCSSDA